MQGNASGGERAQYSGKLVNAFIDSALEFINRESVLPDISPLGNLVVMIFFQVSLFEGMWDWPYPLNSILF